MPNMEDYFLTRFIDDPEAFSTLHEQLKKHGYVTEDEDPHLNRPTHNSLNEDRYQHIFEKHYPSHFTSVKPAVCVFDTGAGFPSFYVVYDQARFEDSYAVKRELGRVGILK